MYYLKLKIRSNILNFPGNAIGRKLVAFESDDWGTIRMPSNEAVSKLSGIGLDMYANPFNFIDTLESEDDLISLFELLRSFKDSKGNHPIITANSLTANPDFDLIHKNNFDAYFFESVKTTYKKSKGSENAFELISEGISAGLYHPQFHGREHLNVKQWMTLLQSGNAVIKTAFDLGVFGIDFENNISKRKNVMASFDENTPEDNFSLQQIVIDGLQQFQELYKIPSKSFIAPCYVWHKNLEKTLFENGVKYIQGIAYQFSPQINGKKYKKIVHYQGESNRNNQLYFIRNAFFEPALQPGFNWVKECMTRISNAFYWGKPAIIGTHRINFVGSLREENRTNTHVLLQQLLSEILKKFPEVEFTTTDRIGDLYPSKLLK